ncbi:hypothetical protein Cfor_10299, partial [Coptotermes formosanus]
MAVPLQQCTKQEQRSVVRFLFSEGVKPIEIHRRMRIQYGDRCMSRTQVYEWTEKFKNRITSVEDSPRPGPAFTAVTEDMSGCAPVRKISFLVESTCLSSAG